MKKCPVHIEFFDDSCEACRQEYVEMKGADRQDEMVVAGSNKKHYKELTEDRAKKLYEELMLQYLKGGTSEVEADRKAKAILRKQCNIRGMPYWPWLQ